VMKRVMFCFVTITLSIGLTFGWAAKPAPVQASEPIVLKAVVPTPVYIPIVAPVKDMYVPGIKEASGGKLTINLMGGPEVIPAESQVDAVRKGIIDMVFTWVSDYRHLVPVAGAVHLSPYDPWEERPGRVFDYWVKVHKPINTQYLGRWAWGMRFNFHMREKEIKTLSDFAGVKMDDPIYIHAIPKAFGMVPLEVSGPDIFTAMERGVIDGYIWSDFGKYPGWEKVTKYVVDEPFLNMDMVILMNQDVYTKLPQDMKDTIEQFTAKYEREATAWYKDQTAKERKKYMDAGCRYIKLPPKEGKYLTETALKVAWEEDVKPVVSQEVYDEARAVLIR